MRGFLQRLSQCTDQLLGNRCFLCDTPSCGLLCAECAARLPLLGPACAQCSLPLLSSERQLCGECLQHPPSFDRIICHFEYYFPLPQLVNAYKHQRHLRSGKYLAQQLSRALACQYTRWPNYLCSVPMHWRKQLLRGFNPAQDIARQLAGDRALPLLPLLVKHRPTRSQQSLDRKQRLRNLTGAYGVNPRYAAQIRESHIAIVDDIVTTGATAEILGRLLKKQGAARVDIWALGRTPKGL